jgi:hypothetical protein
MPPATVPVQCRAPIVSLGSWRQGAKSEGVALLKEKDRMAAGVIAEISAILGFPAVFNRSLNYIRVFLPDHQRYDYVDFFSGQDP